MSIDQKKLISLSVILIAAYLAFGFVVARDWLQGSNIASLLTHSEPCGEGGTISAKSAERRCSTNKSKRLKVGNVASFP
jgi:hypothetical protein